MKRALLTLLCAAAQTFAGAATTDFPEGAAPLTTTSLQEVIAGKVFNVTPDSGPEWRWEFKSNGYFFINIGGFSDTGKWSAKESALCTEGREINASCNEVRRLGSALYLKQDNGNVVKMTPK